jgi:hypothetical protein
MLRGSLAVRIAHGRPKAPAVVEFEGIGPCYWRLIAFSTPRKGEWYLSGAIPMAYRAAGDFPGPSAYHIVTPTHHARQVTVWAMGNPVTLERSETP